MWNGSEYKDKVWKLCASLKVGDEFSIIENVAPERREKFIDVVKYYIDHRCSDNTEIELNNENTKLRKK